MNSLKLNKFISLTLVCVSLLVSLTLAPFVGLWHMQFQWSSKIDSNQQTTALKAVENLYSHLSCTDTKTWHKTFKDLKQFRLYDMNNGKFLSQKKILDSFRNDYWTAQQLEKAKFLDPSEDAFELEIEGTASNAFSGATRQFAHKAIFEFDAQDITLSKVNIIHEEHYPGSSTDHLIPTLRGFLQPSGGTSTS